MTIQELYANLGGNYDDILSRMMKEERILKYIRIFLQDTSFENLQKNLEIGNCQEAFQAAHTLKGVCQNMSFDKLYDVSFEITESLRSENLEQAKEIFPKVFEIYENVVKSINEFLA